jgi:hypothetical protein
MGAEQHRQPQAAQRARLPHWILVFWRAKNAFNHPGLASNAGSLDGDLPQQAFNLAKNDA